MKKLKKNMLGEKVEGEICKGRVNLQQIVLGKLIKKAMNYSVKRGIYHFTYGNRS